MTHHKQRWGRETPTHMHIYTHTYTEIDRQTHKNIQTYSSALSYNKPNSKVAYILSERAYLLCMHNRSFATRRGNDKEGALMIYYETIVPNAGFTNQSRAQSL
jgi:hypothetical protein